MEAQMGTVQTPRGTNALQGETIILFAAAARTVGANVVGAVFDLGGERRRFSIVNPITASATDAGDTLDVYVDCSVDNVVWYNAVHFTQQAGTGAARTEFATLDPTTPGAAVVDVTAVAAPGTVRAAVFGRYMRGRYTIVEAAGVDVASHTFSLVAYAE